MGRESGSFQKGLGGGSSGAGRVSVVVLAGDARACSGTQGRGLGPSDAVGSLSCEKDGPARAGRRWEEVEAMAMGGEEGGRSNTEASRSSKRFCRKSASFAILSESSSLRGSRRGELGRAREL